LNSGGQRTILVEGVDDRVHVVGYSALGSNLGYNSIGIESALSILKKIKII